MDNYPEVNYRRVSVKLANKLAEAEYQNTQLEDMIETLKSQRDQLTQEVESLREDRGDTDNG